MYEEMKTRKVEIGKRERRGSAKTKVGGMKEEK